MATAGNIVVIQRPNIPPTFLGTTVITVKVGETFTITRGMLENTVPSYQHPVSNPKPEIGGILISGFLGTDYREFLSSSNVTQTLGILTNAGSRIYTNGSGSYTNYVITRANLNAGNFKVQGVKVGQGYIKYTARAWDTVSGVESGFSTTEGLIKIEVVNNTNNPPSNVNDGVAICELNNSVTLDLNFFTDGYADPEGDAPNQVVVESLPSASKGILYYLGMQIKSDSLPLYVDANMLDFSVLTFGATGATAVVGDVVTFGWNISDKGSGKFMTSSSVGKITLVARPNVPPTFLGTSTIVVKVGETLNVSRGILENTIPPYQHPVSNPKPEMGGIEISGFLGADYRELLSSSTVGQTIGIFTNNGSRISNDGSGVYANHQITRANLNAGNLKIQGVSIGQGYVKYRAKAWDTINNVESAYSITEGLIKIDVVSNANGAPSVGNGTAPCEINNSVVLDLLFFTNGYSDPNGDPPSQVTISALPSSTKGFLYYLGSEIQASQLPLLINADMLNFSVLSFSATGSTVAVGDNATFSWSISDKGSGKFSNSVTGNINITATASPPSGTKGSTNVIPLNYFDPVATRDIEFTYRGTIGTVKSSIGLTWRDFTIDCTPFDHKYKRLVAVEIIEYGQTDKHDLSIEYPDNSRPLLYRNWTASQGHYDVGEIMEYSYRPNNIYEEYNPARIREWMDPDVHAFLITNISYPINVYDSSVYYVKTVNHYSDGTYSAVNTLYSYRAEYGYMGNYKPGIKYDQYPNWDDPQQSWLTLPLLPNSAEIITSQKLFDMFQFSYENYANPVSNSPQEDFVNIVSMSDLIHLLESMYPALYDFGHNGFPMKLTIWDMNYGNNPQASRSRFIVNGAPMENGMGIPFHFFDEGKVAFITDGMTSGNYTVFFSIMDIITGFIRAKGDT